MDIQEGIRLESGRGQQKVGEEVESFWKTRQSETEKKSERALGFEGRGRRQRNFLYLGLRRVGRGD